MTPSFNYIYGPVPSWRLGSSLGVDLLSQEEKLCNFDCVYCQLGPTKKYTLERKVYVPVQEVIKEIKDLPDVLIDYITFSGRGEPTLARNLEETILAVKTVRKEAVAVLTNSSLLGNDEVRKGLTVADLVVAKLDVCSREYLQEINRPAKEIEFGSILDGIKEFKKDYQGRLALQTMFIGNNKKYIDKYACLANYIQPDEIQVNTPLRACNAQPLAKDAILEIKEYLISACKGIKIVSVYDPGTVKNSLSISDKDTLKRRGKVS